MRNFDFEFDEFKKFVDAVEVGGLRKDAKYDAFAILAAAGEDVILDKYDAMSDSQKKEWRKKARQAVHAYRKGDSDYIINNF